MTTDQHRLTSLLDRLERVVTNLESKSSGATATAAAAANGNAAAASATAAQVTAYDEFAAQHVQPLVDTMRKIGGDLDKMATLFESGFKELRRIVVVASVAKKPTDSNDLMALFKPVIKAMEDAGTYRDSNRASDMFQHLSVVSEGIKCLGWPGVEPTPAPYVKEMLEAANFYGIKILTKYKREAGGEVHIDFVNRFKSALEELSAYVKTHHTTSLKWDNSPSGKPIKEAMQQATGAPAAPAPPAAGGAPPPPPPPPPVLDAPTTTSSGASMTAVFDAINKGEKVTSGLRKVTDDMKTKNRKDRVAVVSLDDTKPSAAAGSSPKAAAKVVGTPKIELQGDKKWVIEHQVGNKNIVIDQTDMKQLVYIFKCTDSVIQVKGKVNGIALDSCSKVGVQFENCVAAVECVNCKSVTLQATGKVPIITIDKTDGAQIYLSHDSLDTTVVTSKSSEMNVNIPEGDDDFTEVPVPEQFVTVYDPKTKKLITTVSDSI